MIYGYKITNNDNGRIYYGITQNSRYVLSRHFELLKEENHWLKLLQKDFKDNFEDIFTYELIIADGDNKLVFDTIAKKIQEDKTFLASHGYNLPYSSSNNDVLYISDEDLIFNYFENGKSDTLKKFNISNNVFLYRMKRNLIGVKKPKISTYDDFYSFVELLLALDGSFLKSAQILDKMISRFTISNRLRITQNKISKNLSGKNYIEKEKKLGYFYYKLN